LHLAYERHLPEISLGVLPGESSQLGQKHRGEPGEGTVVRLNTRVWQSVDSKDLDESQLKVSLASALGLIDSQLTIAQVEPPASTSLRVNDRIVLWNGEKLLDLYDLYQRLSDNKQPTTLVTVIRDFQELEVEVTLKPVDLQKASGLEVGYSLPVLFWGNLVQPDPYVEVYEGPLQGLLYGIKTTLSQSALVAQSIWGLLSGEVPLKALGGPILIAKVAGDSAKMGWMAFVTSMALISINLAVINLFPIPVLDGGQLVMVGAEAVRRRPLSERAMENYQKIGFVMVMALVILATYNDLSRFWRAMLSGVADLF
jgi:regulator of sigma E protease